MKQKGMATGCCQCGRVQIEIGVPARWAWHDQSSKSRHAHGAAYATYVGSWRSRFHIAKGLKAITRFTDEAGDVRSFCANCGTPVCYERKRSPQMINLPRALFYRGTGREPLYHVGLEESPEWAYHGQRLKPLKGFPGVLRTGPKRRKRSELEALFGP